MELQNSAKSYRSPKAKVVEVNVRGILCLSDGENGTGTNSMTIDEEDGGESFN